MCVCVMMLVNTNRQPLALHTFIHTYIHTSYIPSRLSIESKVIRGHCNVHNNLRRERRYRRGFPLRVHVCVCVCMYV